MNGYRTKDKKRKSTKNMDRGHNKEYAKRVLKEDSIDKTTWHLGCKKLLRL